MTNMVFAVIFMLALILGGTWIAISIGISGAYALFLKLGLRTFDIIGIQCWWSSANFVLASIPLFVFMGEFLSLSGIIDTVYEGLKKLLFGIPGELEQSNIVACAVFASASGSSLAGSATMGKIAYPELAQKRGYDKTLTLGSIAAGGTLGILIPPSIIMILYGAIAEESVGQLFMAGLIPGFLLTAFFMIYISARALINPSLIPKEVGRVSMRDRLAGLSIWPFLLLMAIVLGSIYFGLATPTESAAIGASGSIGIAAAYRSLTWKKIVDSVIATLRTTCMIFLIVMCAKIMVMALTYYGVAHTIGQWILGIGSPIGVFIFVVGIYLILGCFFDAVSMIVLTVPLFLPVVESMGFSKIWFGIVVTLCMEAGLLTPPVGVNLFILQGVTGESLENIVKGSWPFVALIILLLVIIYMCPAVTTWLPSMMYQ